jgi:hypothetical protein
MEVKCKFKKDKPDENRHKIIITQDSHAKGCASEVQHNLENRYEISRYSEALTKNDVVMWGGTKDGGKNETQKGLLQINNFVQNHNQTNIIVLGIPHRYNLQINSYMNNYIKVINRKLRKQLKVFENAFLTKVNVDTDQFTRHCFNLNSKGKEQSTKKIVNTIQHISNEKGLIKSL